ncbi:histidine--tRNA ligase [Sulfurospirillum diekertiae]|uniref:Histidine--tRNA ligase n=1 Tax=Sulfurospirillum diekertiae TaxID=1854492 RepID=A0A6G9VPF1_9BACT|nr:histidine--tRNA ligase [Sulfurospirillum diekertiae]QIR74809.1 histidine--tRNA ligase [Sulfurospirillum diekertiae]QIR77473.1 histidine--tRNA ligase [Sulfurospirillum diekertiae]
MINALRGMKDTLSPQSEIYQYIIATCTRIAQNYGFSFMETPILEETALFKRSVGESSDIVGKEMYQFIDKGENDVCLRPEGTAGIVRAFIQQKFDKAGGNRRFFYHGPMFRYERPQKGRLRQFHQFGAESFGEGDVREDATIILMLKAMFEALGIGFTLEINSLGCPACMPQYRTTLVKFLETREGLCEDCERRKLTNPIRVLDCKNEHCKTLLADAPLITENLCVTCKDDFTTLKRILDQFGVSYLVNPKLVRGLDYYSKTAFEFVSSEIGAQSAIAGGGRYDRLVEFLDGKSTPAVGFAMGIERLMELVKMPEIEREGYYIGALCDEALDVVFELVDRKRKTEKVLTDYDAKSLKNHLKIADKNFVKFCVCIGEDELSKQSVWIKDLVSKEEKIINIAHF